jgi:RNA polymerase sigma-70 factor (ECF subfamily)
MEDSRIVDLYWDRDERAITETDIKYGAFCRTLAKNVLSLIEDAEECVNDTYHKAWNSMPTERPSKLKAWLGKVVRNTALDLWRKNHAQRRYSGMDIMLSELEDCVPSSQTVERELEAAELGEHISRWLRTLAEDDRALFVRRYWNGESVSSLADIWHTTPSRLTQRMYRLRLSLRAALEKEGVYI